MILPPNTALCPGTIRMHDFISEFPNTSMSVSKVNGQIIGKFVMNLGNNDHPVEVSDVIGTLYFFASVNIVSF